ncbi:MAG: hypothetical protein ACJAUD_000584 [Crocinitomicaceae bacterium]|jgi:hypothetical protein
MNSFLHASYKFNGYFVILLLILSFQSLSQSTEKVADTTTKSTSQKHTSFDIQYGQRILQKSYLNGQLNSFGNFNFSDPISFIGISVTGAFAVGRRSSYGNTHYSGQMSYSLVIPREITINDTINGKLTGYNFGCSIWGFDVFPNVGAFDLMLDVGFNAGRLRIYGDTLIKQKNPYFAPAVSLTTRVSFGKFALHIRGSYDYDITKKNWRRTFFSRTEKVTISETKLSGIMIFAGIGYNIE